MSRKRITRRSVSSHSVHGEAFEFYWDSSRLTYPNSEKGVHDFQIPDTIDKYVLTLKKFVYALLVSTDSLESTYRFPFTEVEMKAVREMQAKFEDAPRSGPERKLFAKELVPAFNHFIGLFFMIREEPNNPPPPNTSKFDSIIECFLALSAIRSGGTLCRPHDLTPPCAHLKYWIRTCILFEADARVRESTGLQLHQ